MFRVLLLLVVLWCPGRALADCSGGAIPVGMTCGAVGFSGCCEAETLYFCEGNELCAWDCAGLEHCGWNADKGFYDCQTTGMADPGGAPQECPVDSCQGVTYSGCCAGSKVYWCESGALQNLDCSQNGSLNQCGFNDDKGAADCVPPDADPGSVCPFASEGDVLVPADIQAQPDLNLAVDSIPVPDLESPSQCFMAAAAYLVESSDCGVFSESFVTKQEGCVLVYAGLVPSATAHPAGGAGKSGFGFSFTDAGVTRQCQGQVVGEALEGQCHWSGGECAFRFAPVIVTDPGDGEEKKKSGGCSVLPPGTQHTSASLLLLVLACLGLLGRLKGTALTRDGSRRIS